MDFDDTDGGETVVIYCCCDHMGDASVANLIFVGAVYDTILVDRKLRKIGRTFVTHITRFYLCVISVFN